MRGWPLPPRRPPPPPPPPPSATVSSLRRCSFAMLSSPIPILRRESARGQIVENPERSSVRRGNEIAFLHREIMNGDHGQIELQLLPVRAIVERHPDAAFRSGVK